MDNQETQKLRKIGYMRISTKNRNQSLTMQRAALEEFGCERLFADKGISGSKFPRPALTEALEYAQAGDTLVVWRQDRLGRDPFWMEKLLKQFDTRKIAFHSIMQPHDLRTANGRLMFRINAALDAYEVDTVSERTRQGMATHKAKGSRFGRKAKITPAKALAAKKMLSSSDMNVDEVASHFQVSPRTLSRHFKAMDGWLH